MSEMEKKEGPDFDPQGFNRKVMQEIKEKKIKMRSPRMFLAEKLGLEGILVIDIILAALLLSLVVYFIRKADALRFLDFGLVGFKIFLSSIAYEYLALFVLAILLAVYLIHKLDLDWTMNISSKTAIISIAAISFAVGTVFVLTGIDEVAGRMTQKRPPLNSAVRGKIIRTSQREVWVKNQDGRLIRVIINKNMVFPYNPDYAQGKYLRAVGLRENEDDFQAHDIHCCEEDD